MTRAMVGRTGLFIRIALGFLACGELVAGYAQDNIKLRLIPTVEAPIIEHKILKLNVDLVFNRCPQEYWIHYNQETGRLIVEFFGVFVDAPPLAIKGTSALNDLTIFNNETNLALNGKSSQISMTMQKGWHYESWIIGGKVLRIQLWMPLNPTRIIEAQRNRIVLPVVLSIFGIAGISFAIIYAIMQHNQSDN